MSKPQHTTTDRDEESVADDKLRGAIEIGAEIDEPPHRVYYLRSQGRLAGCYKDGRDLIGSKQALAALTTIALAPENENANAAPVGRRPHVHDGLCSLLAEAAFMPRTGQGPQGRRNGNQLL